MDAFGQEYPAVNGNTENVDPAIDSSDAIRDTDIVFDCPYCGHGLVIDNRGAGLVITCANCGKPVQVPIPDGMDISDLDQGPENLQLQIRTMRNALLKAENRERELQKLLSGVTERRSTLEREKAGRVARLGEILKACERAQAQISEASIMLSRINEMVQSELKR